MDRGFAGVLAICIVLSTTITIFIAGEKAHGITLVENRYPGSIYGSKEKGTFEFHHGMVCRQDYMVLEIGFYLLGRTEMNLTLTLEDATPSQLADKVPKISALNQMGRWLGADPLVLTSEIETDDQMATLILLDFTEVFDAFAPKMIKQFPEGARSLVTSPFATLAFAFVFDDSGELTFCYEGIRDFFLGRELLLADLYIRRNDETHSYTSSRMAPQPKGERMLDAPKRGKLFFEDVRRDDRFEIGFSVNSAWVSGSLQALQLIRILGDSQQVLLQASFIG